MKIHMQNRVWWDGRGYRRTTYCGKTITARMIYSPSYRDVNCKKCLAKFRREP